MLQMIRNIIKKREGGCTTVRSVQLRQAKLWQMGSNGGNGVNGCNGGNGNDGSGNGGICIRYSYCNIASG